jgi:hypothetical protein
VNKLKSKCGGHLSTATRYLQQIDLVSLEGVTMRETGFSQFRIFFDKKKGKCGWIRTRSTHTNFCSKKICGMCTVKIVPTHIGCAEVLVGSVATR